LSFYMTLEKRYPTQIARVMKRPNGHLDLPE